MQSKWLVCALFSGMALAQANGGAPAAELPGQQAPATPTAAPSEVKPTDAVVTIDGYCPATPTATKTAGTGATASAAKTKAAAKPAGAGCKTVITRAQFEKLANALAPTLTPQFKRQLANILPRLMVMSSQAEARGLQKTERYSETTKFAHLQILTNELQHQLQEDAAKISDAEIKSYYDQHQDTFAQFSLDRIFVPRNKQEAEEGEAEGDADKDSKLTAEQQKAKQDAEAAKRKTEEDTMAKLAASLRDRAAAGEDFNKLQKEAYDAAGMKIETINTSIPHLRRTGLPQGHASILDLKQGEVSQVITDGGGHYIYRVNAKDEIPLDTAREEIKNTIQNQKLKESMDKLNNSFKTQLNDGYFAAGGSPLRGGPPPHLPRPISPPGAVQPKPAPTPSTPGAEPPAAKPN